MFAAPRGSRFSGADEIDLGSCRDERLVSEGFATHKGFVEAFRVAGFEPNVTMQTDDIFSLINLVAGGVGSTLLPARVASVLPRNAEPISLQAQFALKRHIGLSFLRARERDPNLLVLRAVC